MRACVACAMCVFLSLARISSSRVVVLCVVFVWGGDAVTQSELCCDAAAGVWSSTPPRLYFVRGIVVLCCDVRFQRVFVCITCDTRYSSLCVCVCVLRAGVRIRTLLICARCGILCVARGGCFNARVCCVNLDSISVWVERAHVKSTS